MNENRFSRRYFFYGSLLAGAVPSGGFGSTPSLPALGYKSFNEKLNIAAIGLGTRGPTILAGAAATENVVALCDVDDANAASSYRTYPAATKYKDFRKLLDKESKNIDAVMIATPDHLHAPIALLCMQHGKHVYCEKPLTRAPGESRLLADAAAKYKVATQMGNQGFSHEALKTACEILWSGDIGEVREVHSFTGSIYGGQPNLPDSGPESQPVPDTLDWDLWLGPAASRGFNPLINGHWRAFQDFSTGGSLGDWLVHCIGPAHMASSRSGVAHQRGMRQRGRQESVALAYPGAYRLRISGPRQHASGDPPRLSEHARQFPESSGDGRGRTTLPGDGQPLH
jgi:hypothetical protein